jgi:hypothetical protein
MSEVTFFFSFLGSVFHALDVSGNRREYIGAVTAFHLAKNLGADVAKPDRHLVRLAASQGFPDVHSLCSTIAKETGDPLRIVDIILWRFLVQKKQFQESATISGATAERSTRRGVANFDPVAGFPV